MANRLTKRTMSLFESIKHIDENSNEYWTSRALWKILEYTEYRHFLPVIEKAKLACQNSGQRIEDHFEDVLEMVGIGSGAERPVDSVKLSRYACYLIVQNADPSKAIVAQGQTYFAIQTRIAEVQQMAVNMYPSLIRSEYSQLQYATFLRLIIETPDGGILWHCYQGKDRTGWGAAFLLSALGVERETIIEDFDLSNSAYKDLVEQLNNKAIAQGGGEEEKDVIEAFMGVSTKNFKRTLDIIDNEYGGITEYLHNQLFVSKDDMHLLRQRYLQ